MKKINSTLACLVFAISSFCQEFAKSGDGLIYSDTTIKQLRYIVDSLNIKFRTCDLHKQYLSKPQARAHYIYMEKGRLKDVVKDLDSGISFEELIKKYNCSETEKDLFVVKFRYKDYDEKDVVEFSSIELGGKYEHDIRFYDHLSRYDKPLKGKWVYSHSGKTDYSEENVAAFYFTEELSALPLPEKYARMIQYSDCMVDTSTQVFYEDARRTGVRYKKDEPSKVKEFMSYVHLATRCPVYDEQKSDEYWANYHVWDSLRISRIDSLRLTDKVGFDARLAEAAGEALKNGGSGDEFEEYVGRYYSRKAELEMKRNRIVVGGCSMDQSPRVHALNIAMLSAETVNWEIFLRSHLDIMNDRFQRVSDGSWAWKGRQTYIKELEVLDINVLDLLLGISLRIENPSMNHYYGSIGRLGRALSETKYSIEIETKMLDMISDNGLDNYNRILIYYLFLNYNHHLDDKERKSVNKGKLEAAIRTLPPFIADKMGSEE